MTVRDCAAVSAPGEGPSAWGGKGKRVGPGEWKLISSSQGQAPKPPLALATRQLERNLPPSARVIVDWGALSLVFWVPIVWLFALFVVAR